MNDLDLDAIYTHRIRALQERFPAEHAALLNWGAWSRDERGIRPTLARNAMFEFFRSSEEYADDSKQSVVSAPVKAERPEEEDYDEKSAVELDNRINGHEVPEYLKRALRTAYVDGGPLEARWYRYANCTCQDAFYERLEASLRWAGKVL